SLPPTLRLAPSTWRVVLGLAETSPNSGLRVRVRNSDVLPVLVCPTTEMRSGRLTGLELLMIQPSQSSCRGREDAVFGQSDSAQAFPPDLFAGPGSTLHAEQPDGYLTHRC